MSYQLVLHFFIPQVQFSEVLKEMMVDNLKFTRKDTPGINITSVWLNGFIVPKNLSSRGSRHWSQKKTISYAMPIKISP